MPEQDYGFTENQTPEEKLEKFTEAATYRLETPAKMEEADLKKFVIDLLEGQIYTSAHLRDQSLLGMVFTPLMLGMFRYHSEDEVRSYMDQVGVFWEYMNQAGPRGINGQPMFFSVRIMCRDDWRRAFEAYQAEMARRDSIQLPP